MFIRIYADIYIFINITINTIIFKTYKIEFKSIKLFIVHDIPLKICNHDPYAVLKNK